MTVYFLSHHFSTTRFGLLQGLHLSAVLLPLTWGWSSQATGGRHRGRQNPKAMSSPSGCVPLTPPHYAAPTWAVFLLVLLPDSVQDEVPISLDAGNVAVMALS